MESQTNIQSRQSDNVTEVAVINSLISTLEKHMTTPPSKQPLMKRFMKWLVPDQRVANRHSMPPLTAYLGMVRSSKQYQVGDVSVAGFYMMTEERWIVGTGFPVTLERTDSAGNGDALTVYATVVRIGADGVAFSFLTPADENENTAASGARVDLTALAQFLKGLPLADPRSENFVRAS
jgi:hypothetical protein